MEIVITEKASKKMNEKINGVNGFVKLKYDMEGCGCAVDGVSALWFVSEIDKDDMAIETNDRTIYMEKSKTVFFDEQMKIDFSNEANSFQLKSPNQMLNGRLNFITVKNID